jgi:hypothetical protein
VAPALRDGSPDGYSETADWAESDSPDWAGSLQAGSVLADSIQAGSVLACSVAAGSVAVCCLADSSLADCWVAQTVDDHCVPVARMDDWFRAAAGSPAGLVVDDCQVDSALVDCQVDSAPVDYPVGSLLADYSARPDSPARAVPQVDSFRGAHSPADFRDACSADYPDDSWLLAMALALPAEQ